MLSFLQAQDIIKSHARSFGQEKVLLDDALGRVVAEEVSADRDYPPFNRAAMDGFAIRYADFERGIRTYRIVETIYAGDISKQNVASCECFKIMTGAAVPLSSDTIIRREDAEEKEGEVSFVVDEIKQHQNIARQGEDAKKGTALLCSSTKCTPSVMGLLASVGKYELLVKKLPSMAIVTTGNEVVSVDQPVSEVQIRNSNRVVLKALFKKWNIIPSYIDHINDDPKQITTALAKALEHDIVIVSGGVSAGDADYVPQVLDDLGVQKLFHKVAIRPGKPFWCGTLGSKMIFALPGNPLSTLATFTLFVQHYLNHCFGLQVEPISLPIQVSRQQRVKLDEFFPVQLAGYPSALQPVVFNGSGDIRLGLGAEAFAMHPSTKDELKVGDLVTAYLL